MRHMPTRVGARELRHHLRDYLARARAGERFQITVFDQPVAELVPPTGEEPVVSRLVAAGRLTPPQDDDTSTLPVPAPPIGPRTATDALLAERRADER